MTVAPILTYSVFQMIVALILFAAAFIALLLSVTICLLIGRLVYVGADWVRVKAFQWDHPMLDRYVMSLGVHAFHPAVRLERRRTH
ncbi:MAG: hypothetical protein WAR24_09440 [Candidatus Acidiferrales bacterium]